MYYPHIHFRDRAWLRTALLHYDQLIRIVPEGYDPNKVEDYARFSAEADELAAEVKQLESVGFIRNLAPNKDSVSYASNEFFDFAARNLDDPARRRAVLPLLHRRNPWITLPSSKIDPALAEVLCDLGLARRNEELVYGEWDLEAATGVLYLTYLTVRMADGRPLATDNARYQKLLYSRGRLANDDLYSAPDNEFMLASASFQSALPGNLESIPLDKLLDFRDKHGAVRAAFQAEISKLAASMATARDEHELYSALSAQTEAIARQESLLRDKLAFSFATFASAVFSVSVPSYIVPLATGHPVALAAAGAAVISLAAYKYMLDRRVATASSPYAYLLALGTLSPEEVAHDILSIGIDGEEYDDRVLSY